MDKQFDELSKSLAEGVSRREALRKFGIGLAGVLLAAVGFSRSAWAGGGSCSTSTDCASSKVCCGGTCVGTHIPCYCTTPCPTGTTCQKLKVFFAEEEDITTCTAAPKRFSRQGSLVTRRGGPFRVSRSSTSRASARMRLPSPPAMPCAVWRGHTCRMDRC